MRDTYILFSVSSTMYGLSSRDVAHVELVDSVTRVPNAPPYVDGVVFSRGAVVPAVNLRTRFGFERAPYDARTRLIVVQHGQRTVGLIVDAARDFVSIPEDTIQPPAEGMTSTSGRYLRGVSTLGDRLVLILDVAELFNYDELEAAGRPPVTQER